jgi:hypothetical protein
VAPDGSATVSGPLSDPEFIAGLRPVPSGLEGEAVPWPAVDLDGVSPDGAPLRVALDKTKGPVLLAFLATRCDGCETFWNGLGPSGALGTLRSVQAVVVTKTPPSVDAAEVARLADALGPVPVVMSDRAWIDYRVSGYPFFVLVDPGTRKVVGESVAFGVEDVLGLMGAHGVVAEGLPWAEGSGGAEGPGSVEGSEPRG